MIVSDKVLTFMKEKNYKGIVLSKEKIRFGWAGCREEIQGEFIKEKEIAEYLDLKNQFVEEISGIKVFIPSEIKFLNDIAIDSEFKFFGIMKLKITTK